MALQCIFIDESGDPGLANGCSEYFVMSAVVFRDGSEINKLEDIVRAEKIRKGLSLFAEYKFTKTKKLYILDLLKAIGGLDFEIYGVVNAKSSKKYQTGVVYIKKPY